MRPLEKFLWQIAGSSSLLFFNDLIKATKIIHNALDQHKNFDDAPGVKNEITSPPLDNVVKPYVRSSSETTTSKGTQNDNPDDLTKARLVKDSFLSSAGRRQFLINAADEKNKRKRPLVVMLHGCKQTVEDFAAGTAMNSIASKYGCVVLYPEQDRLNNGLGCWNWFLPEHQQRGRGEPAIISEMTRFVIEKYNIDSRRVYIAGLSAGGAMAAILGSAYSDIFRAVGVHSGLPVGCAQDIPSALQNMKWPVVTAPATIENAIPVIVFHGAKDEIVHPSNGTAIINQFTGGGSGTGTRNFVKQKVRLKANGRWCTRTKWFDREGRTAAEFWLVHGTEHAWTGGKEAGSRIDTLGPCASETMLRFFLAVD
jgi:poly(hydroxyalkanoate) depolymerase family esterase